MRPHCYVLGGADGRTPTPSEDKEELARMFRVPEARRVARDTIGDVSVSTVFLVIDHNFSGDGPPHLFETMVFGGALDEECERCATWAEAEAQHKAMVQRVRTEG